jgi:hypothetical protein
MEEDEQEIISSLVSQYYAGRGNLPKRIYLPCQVEDQQALQQLLTENAGRRVEISVPQRGERVRLVELARKNAADEAKSLVKYDVHPEIFASDIDEKVLQYARENAERAGVDRCIRFFKADAREIRKPAPDKRGTVVCNPPYGERMMEMPEVEALYRDMGRAFAQLDPWQIYVLTSHEKFEMLYGRRADKIKKLYNGMIPCNLYQYFKPKDFKHFNDFKKFNKK